MLIVAGVISPCESYVDAKMVKISLLVVAGSRVSNFSPILLRLIVRRYLY